VDYTAADVYGVTPLMIAADTGRLHNLKTLLKLNMKSDMFK
jgi:ankyrin repeat protein